MKTKLISCLFVVVMFLAFTTPVTANPFPSDQIFTGDVVTISDGFGTMGANFIVHNTSRVMTPFDTFCIEKNMFLSFGIDYTASVNTGALNVPGEENPDPLDFRTAYLYNAFRTNTLITPFNISNVSDVNSLAEAIWYTEDDLTLSGLDAKALLFVAEADAADWTSIGRVRVLNLTFINAEGRIIQKQPLLTEVPEPLTLLLLGFGLLGVGITRRIKK